MGEADGKMGNWLSELYMEAAWKIPHASVNGCAWARLLGEAERLMGRN